MIANNALSKIRPTGGEAGANKQRQAFSYQPGVKRIARDGSPARPQAFFSCHFSSFSNVMSVVSCLLQLVPIRFKQCLGTFSRKHKAYTIFQSQLYKDIFREIVLVRSL